jgi:hypothetical protein
MSLSKMKLSRHRGKKKKTYLFYLLSFIYGNKKTVTSLRKKVQLWLLKVGCVSRKREVG